MATGPAARLNVYRDAVRLCWRLVWLPGELSHRQPGRYRQAGPAARLNDHCRSPAAADEARGLSSMTAPRAEAPAASAAVPEGLCSVLWQRQSLPATAGVAAGGVRCPSESAQRPGRGARLSEWWLARRSARVAKAANLTRNTLPTAGTYSDALARKPPVGQRG